MMGASDGTGSLYGGVEWDRIIVEGGFITMIWPTDRIIVGSGWLKACWLAGWLVCWLAAPGKTGSS